MPTRKYLAHVYSSPSNIAPGPRRIRTMDRRRHHAADEAPRSLENASMRADDASNAIEELVEAQMAVPDAMHAKLRRLEEAATERFQDMATLRTAQGRAATLVDQQRIGASAEAPPEAALHVGGAMEMVEQRLHRQRMEAVRWYNEMRSEADVRLDGGLGVGEAQLVELERLDREVGTRLRAFAQAAGERTPLE